MLLVALHKKKDQINGLFFAVSRGTKSLKSRKVYRHQNRRRVVVVYLANLCQ